MKSRIIVLLIVILFPVLAVAQSGEVDYKEGIKSLPVYEIGKPETSPVFYTGRVYQGAQGHVYPYPMYDVLTDNKVIKDYTELVLENDYVNVSVLPELGGRIFSGTDKDNGYDFFYRQTGIKPALIGMLGAWLSGGVEWNFPHHHRPSSYMAIDWKEQDNEDGSKTIWVGETELRHRMDWAVGVTLYPGRSWVEAKVRIANGTPFTHSMLYWANVSVHCDENYEVIFPPRTQFGTDHSKVSFTKWKMGEIVPGSGQIEDLSLWKNYVYNSRSIFAWNFEDDFLAGYDHGRDAGIVHVANHHQVNGKKFFLWGNNPSAKVWDKMLSDNDGQYLELMVGAYSDNQPDYSWIYPGTVREFSHIWYPIKGIRGVKNATAEGAVNVEFDKNGKMFIGFNTTTLRKDARVKVFYGDETIFEEVVTLDPNTPYTNIIDVKKFPAQTLFTVSLCSQEGQDLISYTPVRITEAPMPEVVSDVKSPSEYTTIEDLYLTGLRLEQFHNARVLPEPYYLEALARDSTDARVNTAMGIRYLKKGSFDLAGKYLQRAVDKLTRDYTTPKEIEPLYYLALCNELQGRLKEAEDLYWKVTWSTAYQHPAYLALARIAAIEEDYGKALEHIENAVYTGGRNPEAYIMGACFLRKTGRVGEALSLLDKVVEISPLDRWADIERVFCNKGSMTSADLGNVLFKGDSFIEKQDLIETVRKYMQLGAYDDALAVLEAAVGCGAPYDSFPLVYYYAGYCCMKVKSIMKAYEYIDLGHSQPTDYCFPFRIEEIEMFQDILKMNPEDEKMYYYLGNLYYYLDQYDNGIACWKKAVDLGADFKTVFRNLGFAYGRKSQFDIALEYYGKAIEIDNGDPRLLVEADNIREQAGDLPEVRLKLFSGNINTAFKHGDAVLRLVSLYIQTGKYDEAIDILDNYHFHVWEGGGNHNMYVDAHLLRGIEQYKAGNVKTALKDFVSADAFPDNLEVGQYYTGYYNPKVHYYIGMAYDKLGDRRKAKYHYSKVSAIDESDFELCYYKIMACLALGEKSEADMAIRRMQERIGRIDEEDFSIDQYSKFGNEGNVNENRAKAYYYRGLAYLIESDTERANECFEKAVAMDSDSVWAKVFLNNDK